MFKRNYYLLIIILMFVGCLGVEADTCDSNDIARLKAIARDVTVSYEYNEEAEKAGIYGDFDVSVSGITEEIYGRVDLEGSTYFFNYDSENEGTITYGLGSGEKSLVIYSSNCDVELRKVKIKTPYYNIYSNDDKCDGISGDKLEVCSKFLDYELSYSKFNSEMDKYLAGNSSGNGNDNFISKYKYYFIGFGLVIVIGIAVFIIKKRHDRNVLD